MRIPVVIFIVALHHAATARAQTCPPVAPIAGAAAWFEFQVDEAARFIPVDVVLPFPDPSLNQRAPSSSDFALVSFVVDTNGVPLAHSLKILVRPDGLVADSVAAAVLRWRFQPAKVRACRVPQLVQSALRWK